MARRRTRSAARRRDDRRAGIEHRPHGTVLTMDRERQGTAIGIAVAFAAVGSMFVATAIATGTEQRSAKGGIWLTLPPWGWLAFAPVVALAAALWWRTASAGVRADGSSLHVRNGLLLTVTYPYLAVQDIELRPDPSRLRRLFTRAWLGGDPARRWECPYLVLADGSAVACTALASPRRPRGRSDAAIRVETLRRLALTPSR